MDTGINGGMAHAVPLGLNWYLKATTPVQWNYVAMQRDFDPTDTTGRGAGVTSRLARLHLRHGAGGHGDRRLHRGRFVPHVGTLGTGLSGDPLQGEGYPFPDEANLVGPPHRPSECRH